MLNENQRAKQLVISAICVLAHVHNRDINTTVVTLQLLGIAIGVKFDNNQTAASLSDVQPRQIVSIRIDVSLLLTSKQLDTTFVSV